MVTLLFGLATWLLFRMQLDVGVLPLFYPLFVVVYAATAIFAQRLRHLTRLTFFAYSQFFLDALCVTVVVAFTGSSQSLFTLFYIFIILASGLILRTRGGLISATMITVCYLGVLALPLLGFEPIRIGVADAEIEDPGRLYRISQVTVQLLAFYLIAWLSGTLSSRLQESQLALRRAGVDLAELRELHDSTIENIATGLLTIDEGGRVTSLNRAASRITGFALADALRRPLDDVLPGATAYLASVVGGATGSDGTSPSWIDEGHSWEANVSLANGQRRYLRHAVSTLRDRHGVPAGKILVFDDLTEVRSLQEKMAQDRHMAEVGKLAAGIVHEIRNPLAAISGSAQLLTADASLQAEDRRLLDIIVREADRLNGLVSNFLGVARDRPLELGEVRLHTVISETLELLRVKGHAHPELVIEERYDYRPLVRCDADRTRQVFWNLFTNAFQAMPSGGTLTVTTERVSDPEAEPDALQITVADTGEGISEEVRERIFDPFFSRRSGGTGLGLAISRQIIQDHGGRIEVRSEPGRGTTFTITLPVEEADPSGRYRATAIRRE